MDIGQSEPNEIVTTSIEYYSNAFDTSKSITFKTTDVENSIKIIPEMLDKTKN